MSTGADASLQGIIFRRARPPDADDLRRFRCRNPGEKYTRDVERLIQRGWADEVERGAGLVLVAVDPDVGQQLVGVICYGIEEGDEGSVGKVHALAVVPTHRRRGIATALKQRAAADVGARGYTQLLSLVHRRNTAMLALNATRFSAVDEPDPDDGEFRFTVVVTDLTD